MVDSIYSLTERKPTELTEEDAYNQRFGFDDTSGVIPFNLGQPDSWKFPKRAVAKKQAPDGLGVAFSGIRGQGKSLVMTDYGLIAQKMGVLLVANYEIYQFPKKAKCSDYNPSTDEGGLHDWDKETFRTCKRCGQHLLNRVLDLKELLDFPEWLKRAYVMWDEIDRDMHRATTLVAELLDNWLRQIRKKRVYFLWASQFPQQIPTFLINQTDLFYRCSTNSAGSSVTATIMDVSGVVSGKEHRVIKKVFPNTSVGFGRYDTGKIFNPWSRWDADARSIIKEHQKQGEANTENAEDMFTPIERKVLTLLQNIEGYSCNRQTLLKTLPHSESGINVCLRKLEDKYGIIRTEYRGNEAIYHLVINETSNSNDNENINQLDRGGPPVERELVGAGT